MRISKARKRNRFVSFLLLPILAGFWLVGWTLYWIGSPKKKIPTKPILPSVSVNFDFVYEHGKVAVCQGRNRNEPKVIILDNNPLSIACYLEEYGKKESD